MGIRACKEHHSFGPGQSVGAGIERFRCVRCGTVRIDLEVSGDLLLHGAGLFQAPRRSWMLPVAVLLPDPTPRYRFGQRPERRRQPAAAAAR